MVECPAPPAPYYSDDHVTLYHGDARNITAWLTADVLVTDPPYGRDWRQGDLHGDKRNGIAGDKNTDTRDAALRLWGNRPAIMFGDLMLPPPADTRQVLIYSKPVDAGLRGAMAGFRRDAEAIYLIGPGWPSGLGGTTSILRSNARMVGGTHGIATRTGHPHTKPLDVMERLLLKTHGVVADPFAGSGSTLVAARNLGRQAIGVEIEEWACEIAARRLAQDVLPIGGHDG